MATARRLRRLAVTITVTLALVVAGVVIWRWSTDPDCLVEVGDSRVELSTEQAELVTRGKAADLDDDDAAVVGKAVSGSARHALTCRHGGASSSEPDALNNRGLTARADAVRRALGEDFDGLKFGGYQKGGVRDGHMPGSAHYDGRAIDVFFRPINDRNKARGWATAHYLVAHAERLKITTVIYDARIWTARRGFQGWRDYVIDTSGKSAAVRKVLLHRDHVHVDVAD